MERRRASDFPQAVIDLYTRYSHGAVSRRDFLERAGRYAVGGFTAAAMLEALSPNFAWGQQVGAGRRRPRNPGLSPFL